MIRITTGKVWFHWILNLMVEKMSVSQLCWNVKMYFSSLCTAPCRLFGNPISPSRIKIGRGGQVLFDCSYFCSTFTAYISTIFQWWLVNWDKILYTFTSIYQVSTVTDHKLICCEVLSNRMSSFTLWIMHCVCRKVKRQFVVAKDWSSVAVALAHWSAEKVVLVYCSLFQPWLPIWWSMSLIDCDWLMKHRDWF